MQTIDKLTKGIHDRRVFMGDIQINHMADVAKYLTDRGYMVVGVYHDRETPCVYYARAFRQSGDRSLWDFEFRCYGDPELVDSTLIANCAAS